MEGHPIVDWSLFGLELGEAVARNPYLQEVPLGDILQAREKLGEAWSSSFYGFGCFLEQPWQNHLMDLPFRAKHFLECNGFETLRDVRKLLTHKDNALHKKNFGRRSIKDLRESMNRVLESFRNSYESQGQSNEGF